MHNAKCQEANDAAHMLRAGYSPGEPPEIKWSVISQLGKFIKYSTLVHRQGRLETLMNRMEQEADCKIGVLLMRMGARAYDRVSTTWCWLTYVSLVINVCVDSLTKIMSCMCAQKVKTKEELVVLKSEIEASRFTYEEIDAFAWGSMPSPDENVLFTWEVGS